MSIHSVFYDLSSKDDNSLLKRLYSGAGMVLTLLLMSLITISIVLPLLQISISNSGKSGVVFIFSVVFPVILAFLPSRYRNHFYYIIRDVAVRVYSSFAIFALFWFYLIGAFYIPGEKTTSALAVLGFPILTLTFAAALALFIRFATWARIVISTIRAQFRQEGTTGMVPIKGHSNVQAEIVTERKVELAGMFGYDSCPTDKIWTGDLMLSFRSGLKTVAIPYVLNAATVGIAQLYPDATVRFLKTLPTESATVDLLNFVGVPEAVVTETLAAGGYDTGALSLALYLVMIPAVMMIPAAWNFLVAYEKWQYSLIKRINRSERSSCLAVSESTHLLVLFSIHFSLLLGIALLTPEM
jgi:hypothetical protein